MPTALLEYPPDLRQALSDELRRMDLCYFRVLSLREDPATIVSEKNPWYSSISGGRTQKLLPCPFSSRFSRFDTVSDWTHSQGISPPYGHRVLVIPATCIICTAQGIFIPRSMRIIEMGIQFLLEDRS
jgi:hypothetical protein